MEINKHIKITILLIQQVIIISTPTNTILLTRTLHLAINLMVIQTIVMLIFIITLTKLLFKFEINLFLM